MGLVNRLTPEGEALEAALQLAAVIAQNGPLAVVATKAIARQAAGWTLEERWRRQQEIVAPVLDSADAREGAAAFVEKRTPTWRGR